MRILLDTHALVWLAEGTPDLRPSTRSALERAAAGSGLAVSSISFWEVAMLAERGRLSLAQPLSVWRRRVVSQPGILEVPVDGEVALEAVLLPGRLHADPADRMIAATARIHGMRLATRDRRLLEFGAAGHLKAMAV